jgi:glycosyltransferase involved in cell wall biosynthesis
MSFQKANELMRSGNYDAAEKIYIELYAKNGFEIYKQSLDVLRIKRNETQFIKNDVITEKPKINSRILFVTSGLKGPTAGGGIATCFHSMIKTISEVDTNYVSVLYVAHPYYAHENKQVWHDYYKNQYGVKFITIDINKNNYGSQEMQRSFGILDYLISTNNQYDTIVFHDYMGLAYYSLLAKKYKIALQNSRIIISAHGNHTLSYYFGDKKVNTWNERVVIFMEREALKLADEVITPSDYYSNWLINNFGVKKCTKIPNIILVEANSNVDLKIKFKDENKQLLVFYGRFERLKGLDVFLDAIIKYNTDIVKNNILFAGNSTKIDGIDAKEYVEKKLFDCKCEVKFQLNCNSNSLYKYVKDNDGVCVFPTLGETSSCVVVECTQLSVKFIASGIPGIKELLNQDVADKYLFTPNSVNELIAKFINLPPTPNSSMLSFGVDSNKQNWKNFFQIAYKPKNIFINNCTDLISVIIPTCNRHLLLEQAIISIKNQTYKNIEIIIVDDASINFEFNELIAKKYDATYIYSSEKIYKGAACNLAFKKAHGKYICFFDGDDIAKPNMLINYMNVFSADDLVDIVSGFAECFEHKEFESEQVIDVKYVSLALGGGLEVNSYINFFGKGTFIIKTEKFDKTGGYEIDTDTVPMVDYRFYLKATLCGLNISIVPTGQYFYRKNSPNSLFYENRGTRHLQYLAKRSIENLFKNRFGHDVGEAFSSLIWHTSLPALD